MCQALEVSRSGYYAWEQRPTSQRAREDGEMTEVLREEHQRSRGTYGSPRLHQRLLQLGYRCGRHRVARLMHQAGLRGLPRRKYRGTTRRVAGRPLAPDRLQRDFTASGPNEKWVADITYIPTDEGWLYLAVVMDLFSRHIVGWAMHERMTDDLVLNALNMAVQRRQPAEGLIHHSDRGGQYTSARLQAALAERAIQCSMGTRGDCFDNAGAESFIATLKREEVHQSCYPTRQRARRRLFQYIEVFYNRQRLHSALGYVSPVEFELLIGHAP
jgi:putative transposase